MRRLVTFILSMTIFFGYNCSNKLKDSGSSELSRSEKIENIAKESFGDNYQLLENQSKSWVCIYQEHKSRPTDIFATYHFLIYNPSENKLAFEDKVARAKIEWISDEEFQTTFTPGRIKNEKTARKLTVYNVATGRKNLK